MTYSIAKSHFLGRTPGAVYEKAWAAIKDGQVVALALMGDYTSIDWPQPDFPAWVEAALNGSPQSARKRAVVAGHTGVGPSGGRITGPTLYAEADNCREWANNAAFETYRTVTRAKLAELGEVVSGEAVGWRDSGSGVDHYEFETPALESRHDP